MGMNRQQIDVPLTTGLSQKQDVRDVQASGAVLMSNCVMQKNGAVTKRAGNGSIPSTTNNSTNVLTAINGGSYKGAPWVSDGESLCSWSNFNGNWVRQDVISDAVCLDRIGIASFTQAISDMDQQSANGYLFVVLASDPLTLGFQALFYTVIDLSSGVPVVPLNRVDNAQVNSAIAPKLILCGTTLVLTYINSTAIVARKLSVSTPTAAWSAETTLATDGFFSTSTGVYDAAETTGDATRFAIAYEVNPGINGGKCVKIATYTVSSLAVAHAEVDDAIPTGHLTSIALLSQNAQWHWAAYWGTTAAPQFVVRSWAWFDPTPATHVAPWTVYTAGAENPGRIALGRNDTQDVTAYWSPAIDTTKNNGQLLAGSYVRNAMLNTSSGNTRVIANNGCVLTSKPFVTSTPVAASVAFIAVQTPSTNQGTAFLCKDDGWSQAPPLAGARGILRAVATLDPRLMKNTSVISMQGTFWQTLPHIVQNPSLGTNTWMLPAFESTSPTHQAIYNFPIDIASTQRHFSSELYELEAISAGVPSVYDGQAVCEQSFLAYPEIASATFGAAGSMQTSGLYQYVATYEIYDNRGQLTQSGTSPPFAVTATGAGNNGSCVVVVPGLSLTQRQDEALTLSPLKATAYVVLYRTQANGTVFYRSSTDPPPAAQQVVGAGFSISITDTISDQNIAKNAVLYTTGGNLDNLNPPSSRICIQHRNRWWMAGCPDPTSLWPSKELTTGIVPAWNENYNITCSGAIRALASMDDKLVVFVQRGQQYGLEFISGEGPFDNGLQSDWSPPQRIPSDSGAVDQRGVCAGPFGVLYRSNVGGPKAAGGIFLLSRDLQVSYVGRGVEDLLGQFPTVTSMVLHPSNGRVYITCVNPSAPTQGVRLVWDYVQGGVWSSDTVGVSGGAYVASWIANLGGPATVFQATSAGAFLVEDTSGTVYTDNGAFVTMTYRSAWLKPSKSGFARFWRVLVSADANEAADIAVQLTFDYAGAAHYQETATWQAATIATFDRFPQVDVDMTPNLQKAKAIQIQFNDSIPLSFTTGQGYSLGAISLDIGVKEGPYQNIPFAQRA